MATNTIPPSTPIPPQRRLIAAGILGRRAGRTIATVRRAGNPGAAR